MKQAKWIWIHHDDLADEYGEFFDSFESGGKRAEISISCDSQYALYLNGALAGFGQYADYPWYKVYDKFDVTKYLKKGRNSLKLIVWYIGHDYFTYYKGKPGLSFEIEEEGVILSHSAEGMSCRLSGNYVNYLRKEITNQILGYSFRYDTRKAENALHPAVEVGGFSADLHPRPVKLLELTDPFFGKLIDEEKKIYDLGCERVGFLHIRFRAGAGTLVNVAFGEHLTDGGVRRFINTYPLREGILPRDYSVEVIGSGETEEYVNPFRRIGSRYLQITADGDFEIESIGLKETLYPVQVVPFQAENELRQKIYDTAVRTLRLCMHEHYEDCPWREQVLYALDSRNQMLCGYYVFREYEFARAGLKLLGMNKLYHGLIATSAPNNDDGVIPSFSLHYVMQMQEYIEHSGDLTLAEEMFPKMAETMKRFFDHMEDGLVPIFNDQKGYFNFYEWSDDMESELFQPDETRTDLQLNCLYAMALNSFESICGALGKPFPYEGVRGKLVQAIDERFYNPETGLYHINELGNSLAVLCGAAKGERARAVCETLSRENNGLVPVTLSMIRFKYEALLLADRAYKQAVLRDIDKNYGYMLSRGATSFWETIKGESDFNDAGSLCHGWSAMPVYFYWLLAGKEYQGY